MTAQGYGNQESVDETEASRRRLRPGDVSDRRDPVPPAQDRREEATPGDGAGPTPSGRHHREREVDPGLG